MLDFIIHAVQFLSWIVLREASSLKGNLFKHCYIQKHKHHREARILLEKVISDTSIIIAVCSLSF